MTRPEAPRISNLANQILAGIKSGQYAPGARLRQEELAKRFSVSRTPVREALRVLETQGFVRHTPNQGAIVRVPDLREIREAYRVRAELEGFAAELAAEWITDAEIEELKTAEAAFADVINRSKPASSAPRSLRSSKPSKDEQNWVKTNDRFHDVILAACGNQCLRRILNELHLGQLRPVMLMTVSIDGWRMRENVAQHAAIVAAIEHHDKAEARLEMVRHVEHSGAQMIRWLEHSDDDA